MANLIPLTQGKFAIVDDCNYDWLMQWKWCVSRKLNNQNYYAVRGSKIKKGRQYLISMAREILGLKRGDKRQADHVNHDTLDNRRTKLRVVTNQQNGWNSKNTKGYSWNKVRKKYEAYIKLNDKKTHLGLFHTANEAHSAYLQAKEKYHKF